MIIGCCFHLTGCATAMFYPTYLNGSCARVNFDGTKTDARLIAFPYFAITDDLPKCLNEEKEGKKGCLVWWQYPLMGAVGIVGWSIILPLATIDLPFSFVVDLTHVPDVMQERKMCLKRKSPIK